MQTVFLEFRHENGALAANGTDMIFYIDGRWKWETTRSEIEARVAWLRRGTTSRYKKQLFVGYTYSGGREGAIKRMSDPNPPQWHKDRTVHIKVTPSS